MRLLVAVVLLGSCNYSFHSSLGGSAPAPGPAASPSAPVTIDAPSQGAPPSRGDEPVKDPGFAKLAPPPLPAGPPPVISIVSPASDEELVGASTKAPDDRFESLPCLQDARTFAIKLAAKNWSVAPGGQGVLVVVDGVYATVTHDLGKPILMAELEPYERVDNSATFADEGPMYACGHHWIAAVPTAANGQMLPVAPTVSWFFNRSKDYWTRDEDADARAVRLERSLPVVNWPLIGALYVGTSWRWSHDDAAHRSGRIVRDPKRVVFDWVLARGTRPGACKFKISQHPEQGDRAGEVQLPTRGAVILPDAYLTDPLIVDAEECGGMSDYAVKLWTRSPSALPKHAWPVPGSSKAEDFWSSDEGHAAFRQMGAGSHEHSAGGGGGGKCKSQCTVEAGRCRTSCRGAKCANDCNKAEQACKSGC